MVCTNCAELLDEAVLRDLHPLVVAIQQVEGFAQEFQFDTIAKQKTAGQSHVGGGVVGSDQRVRENPGSRSLVVLPS